MASSGSPAGGAAGWGPRLDAPVPGSPGLEASPGPSALWQWHPGLASAGRLCLPALGHSVGGVRARARCQSGLRPLRWDMDQLRDKPESELAWPMAEDFSGAWLGGEAIGQLSRLRLHPGELPALAGRALTRPRGSGPRPLRWGEGGGAGGWEGHLLDGGRGCPAPCARRGAWARSSGGGDPPGPGGAAAVSPQPP